MTKKSVCIVGCGNLGKRHLEGLSKSGNIKEIYLVDPSLDNLAAAEKLNRNSNLRIIKADSLEQIPKELDLAIIATQADVRRQVLERLLLSKNVKSVILEKILFSKITDFEPINKLLLNKGVKCEVNFVRRKIPFYQHLKNLLTDEKTLRISVSGINWGLASNSVHFLDLLLFLGGKNCFFSMTSKAQLNIKKSKRDNCVELLGRLNFDGPNSILELSSDAGSKEFHKIVIQSENYKIEIDEINGYAKIFNAFGDASQESFNFTFQSDLTGAVADDFFMLGTGGLTAYPDAIEVHQLFFEAVDNVPGIKNKYNEFLIT